MSKTLLANSLPLVMIMPTNLRWVGYVPIRFLLFLLVLMPSATASIASPFVLVGVGAVVVIFCPGAGVRKELDGGRPISPGPFSVAAPAVLAPALLLPLAPSHARWVRRYGGKIQLEFVRVAVLHRHRGPHAHVRPLTLKLFKPGLSFMQKNNL